MIGDFQTDALHQTLTTADLDDLIGRVTAKPCIVAIRATQPEMAQPEVLRTA